MLARLASLYCLAVAAGLTQLTNSRSISSRSGCEHTEQLYSWRPRLIGGALSCWANRLFFIMGHLSMKVWVKTFVLKGEFQRANITRTKLSGVLEGKLLISK